MRRLLIALAAALLPVLLVPTAAFAHPLGNFTVNRYSRVEVADARLSVLYVLDMAEIPTFQEQQRIRADSRYLEHKVGELGSRLQLVVDGRRLQLRAHSKVLRFPPGQGGLPTMRLEVLYDAGLIGPGSHSATFADTNYGDRLGWCEVVVQSSGGAHLARSTAPRTSVSRELQKYPQDLLTSPMHVSAASFTFAAGSGSGSLPVLRATGSGLSVFQDRFAALIAGGGAGSLPLMLAALLVALGLGVLHALEPGHGKAVMAGYLVGTRGRGRDAVWLGLTITATHTAGVFALGLVTLLAAGLFTPERIYPWLTLASGLLVVGVGGTLLIRRLRHGAPAGHRHPHTHGHEHEHGHEHPHADGHANAAVPRGRWSLVLLGVSGGLIPCPAALVVLLAALSLHRLAFGLLLIVAFSAGLASALTGLGLVLAGALPLARRTFSTLRPALVPGFGRWLPVASSVVVIALGVGLCVQALEVVL